MNPRIRNLALAASVPLVALGLAFQVTDRSAGPEQTTERPNQLAMASPAVAPPPTASAARSYSYAVDLSSLKGLPPDLETGTPVEIWVTWDRGERVAEPQRWITGARFERIVPATTSGGPDVAILEIPARQRQEMVWAATFATLTLFADDG